jgi:hypothetical protein
MGGGGARLKFSASYILEATGSALCNFALCILFVELSTPAENLRVH